MGVLIFAFRKLFLKRKINDIEYRSMILSQKNQTVTDQIGVTQQAMSTAKNALSIFTSSAMNGFFKEIQQKYGTKDENGAYTIAENKRASAETEMMTKQTALQAFNYASNSVFEQASIAQLQPLKNLDTQITLEMANLESQLKQLRPELESVEKAETEAAKQEAPKFGLG